MAQRERLVERVARSTDLNMDIFPGESLVELVGEHRALIENHKGVIQYSRTEIVIKVKFGCICIRGNGLELLQMTKERLVIGGCIDGVHLSRRALR